LNDLFVQLETDGSQFNELLTRESLEPIQFDSRTNRNMSFVKQFIEKTRLK